ncbi:TIGR03643 family protein [Dyadobacter frigoris]|nr:TIGR03643 family protein [Dyadobacter frigoris]
MYQFKNKKEFMTAEETDRIIEMAWEDRTPFEAIDAQFGISESKVIQLMRGELKRSSFNLWRKRVNSGISQKHLLKRDSAINRFKSKMQRAVSMNAISKR